MEIFLKFKRNRILFFTILILSLCIRWYWAEQKEGMHVDEVATFSVSDTNGAYPGSYEKIGGRHTGMELKQYFFIHDASLNDVFHDIKNMWHDVHDYNHTNFFYSIIRLFFIGNNTTDNKSIQRRGILLNLIFYIIEFVIFLKLLLFYYRNSPIVLFTALTCFAFMTGCVSNTLFIRTYELQTLMVLLLSWWLTYALHSMNNKRWNYNIRNFIITSLILTGVLLSGYFMVVLVAIFGLSLMIVLYKKKDFKKGAPFFIGTSLCALVLCKLFYLRFFLGFHGDRRITSKLTSEDTLSRLYESIIAWGQLIIDNTLYLPVIILLSVIFIISTNQFRKIPWVVFPSIVYSFIISLLSPYINDNRYIVAVTPLFILLIPTALKSINWRNIQIGFAIALTLIYFVSSIREKNISNYLFKGNITKELLANNKSQIHIVQKLPFSIVVLLPFMNDNVSYNICNNIDSANVKHGDIIFFNIQEMSSWKKESELPLSKFDKLGSYQNYYIYKAKH